MKEPPFDGRYSHHAKDAQGRDDEIGGESLTGLGKGFVEGV